MGLNCHFINVGKGDCTVVEPPSGRLTVIDVDDSRALSVIDWLVLAKSGSAHITNPVDYIVNNFSSDIFRFILTHPDMDHMSGIKELFRRKNVIHFWDTGNNKTNAGSWGSGPYNEDDWLFYEELHKAQISGITYLQKLRGFTGNYWTQDGIEVLSPTAELIKEANEKEDWDHLSYVFMITYAGRKILLTGDATQKAWEDIANHYGDNLKCDVLCAPNHGSANHMSKEILDVINPGLIVVSVAQGVSYARDLYSKYGTVLSTKHYGNIWVYVADNGELYFRTQYQQYGDDWYVLKQKSNNLTLEQILSAMW